MRERFALGAPLQRGVSYRLPVADPYGQDVVELLGTAPRSRTSIVSAFILIVPKDIPHMAYEFRNLKTFFANVPDFSYCPFCSMFNRFGLTLSLLAI